MQTNIIISPRDNKTGVHRKRTTMNQIPIYPHKPTTFYNSPHARMHEQQLKTRPMVVCWPINNDIHQEVKRAGQSIIYSYTASTIQPAGTFGLRGAGKQLHRGSLIFFFSASPPPCPPRHLTRRLCHSLGRPRTPTPRRQGTLRS